MHTPYWSDEVFVIKKKLKKTVSRAYVINDLDRKEIVGTSYKKESQNANQNEFKIEKINHNEKQ